MSAADAAPSFNPVRTVLKALGSFADVTTFRGKALKKAEGALTDGFSRLSGSDAYLRAAGKAMERSFIVQAQTNRAMERALKAARIPSATTLHAVHAVATSLDEKLDALGCQMEVLMDRLDDIDARLSALEAKAPPKKRASSKKKAAGAKGGAA